MSEARIFLLGEDYELIGNTKRVKFKRRILTNEIEKVITCEFYYKSQLKEDEQIPWLQTWNDFFEFDNMDNKTYTLNSGCILLNFDSHRYIISYGRAHQTIQKKSNLNFGLDVAEKIIDPAKIQVKNSAFINNQKSRAYTQFRGNSQLIPEIGESSNQVIGNISVGFLDLILYKFKESIKFSTSIKIVNNEITDKEMIEIVAEFHYINKFHEIKNPIPRMEIITKNEVLIHELNRKLLLDISKGNAEKFTLQQLVDDGGNMRFPFSEGDLDLHYFKPYKMYNYSVEAILNVVITNDIKITGGVKIRNQSAGESYELLRLLDYCTIIDSTTYTLFEGKWAKFNKSFVQYLEEQIILVNEITTIDEDFNLTDKSLREGRALMNAGKDYDKVNYAEYPYNIFIKEMKGLVFLDRKSEHKKFSKIEFADLYCSKEKKLTHVKIGDTTDFRYCISQSQNSARILSTDRSILENYGITVVNDVEMLLVTKLKNIISNNKIDFNKSMSINFKLELVTWYQYVRQYNFTPRIVVARDIRV